ncbi:MAG: 3'(2'),5'-bisphosphate nucleotidase CysQ [Beijerinckiaceae bacterium]|nr:3'(2'),5'-bisphosphate nucleotidase CysQ [Beijerinckiaceae bacterium]
MASSDALAAALAEIARTAGRVLAQFQCSRPPAEMKADQSPVTEADRASEAVILQAVAVALPGIPVISEENAESHGADGGREFLLVDPLDGTRAFLAGTPDFCVSIALVRDGMPVAGALHAPMADETWWGGTVVRHACGSIADGAPLPPRLLRAPGEKPVALASHFHGNAETEDLLARCGASRIIRMSSALKFVKLLTGEADLYPRRTRTMQWDIAGGDALLRALGGGLLGDDGQLLCYGRGAEGWAAPCFMAYGALPR